MKLKIYFISCFQLNLFEDIVRYVNIIYIFKSKNDYSQIPDSSVR